MTTNKKNNTLSSLRFKQNYAKALKTIIEKIENKNINWVIYGSAGLALRGLDFEIHDIDILTNKNGAFTINDALKEYVITPVHLNNRPDRFESYIGEFCINNIAVELVGNYHRKLDDKNISFTKTFLQPDYIKLEKMTIPVMSLQNQLEAYKLCNREKDQIKIQKISKELQQASN